MARVDLADIYEYGDMSSSGQATRALLRQSKFPYEYDENLDSLIGEYSDRLHQFYGFDHWKKACKLIKSGRDMQGFLQYGKVKDIIPFLQFAMKADPDVKWTGFRILGGVNKATAYPYYIFQLFAKSPASKTKVYSSLRKAPNIKSYHEDYHEGYYYEVF